MCVNTGKVIENDGTLNTRDIIENHRIVENDGTLNTRGDEPSDEPSNAVSDAVADAGMAPTKLILPMQRGRSKLRWKIRFLGSMQRQVL